jgi:hypothetical protein
MPAAAGFPGAMPGAMPGLAGAFGPQLPPGLISNPLPAVPAPPPRARPAAPPGVWLVLPQHMYWVIHGAIR